MPSRRLLAGLAVLALVATAGCLGPGTDIPEETLAEDAEYDWETEAETEVRLTEGQFLQPAEFRAVYSGNASSISLSTQGLTRRHSVPISAVQYRYAENGTVAGHEAVAVERSAEATTIELPEAEGQLAFSSERHDQELRLRTVDDGDVRVVLPANHTVGDLLLSHVQPRDYGTERDGTGREALYWDSVDGDTMVLVQHYRERDWYIFYGMVGVLGVVALIGYAYFSREIRQIRRRREEAGLDLDEGDEGGRPPPGFG